MEVNLWCCRCVLLDVPGSVSMTGGAARYLMCCDNWTHIIQVFLFSAQTLSHTKDHTYS